MNTNMYYKKYLKYKQKYLELKKQFGGSQELVIFTKDKLTQLLKIDVDESDDIVIVKNLILQKLNNPNINEETIALYEYPEGKTCKNIELNNLPAKANKLCIAFKKSVNPADFIPINIKSGNEVKLELPNNINLVKHLKSLIPKPKIDLLQDKILKAVKEIEEKQVPFIDYHDYDKSKFIKTENVILNSSNELKLSLPSELMSSSLSEIDMGPPPMAPRLEDSRTGAKNSRNDLLELINISEPYKIFEVKADASKFDQKFWLKTKNNDLMEIIVTTEGKVLSIINKGPILL